jgi:hypothetical protein
MEDKDVETELAYCRELIAQHRKSLHILQLQEAQIGVTVPLQLHNEIATITKKLQILHEKVDLLLQIQVLNYKLDKLIRETEKAAKRMQAKVKKLKNGTPELEGLEDEEQQREVVRMLAEGKYSIKEDLDLVKNISFEREKLMATLARLIRKYKAL